MKKFLSYMFVLIIVATYIVSTMGYGIHECKHDGTKDVVVLFGETPCEYVHSHLDNNGHLYTHSHSSSIHETDALVSANCSCCDCATALAYEHSDNCCHTTVYSITHDQTIENNADIAIPFIYLDFAILPLIISSPISYTSQVSIINIKEKIPNIKGELYIFNRTLIV